MSIYKTILTTLINKTGISTTEEVFDYLGKTTGIADCACRLLPSRFFPKIPDHIDWRIDYAKSLKVARLISKEEITGLFTTAATSRDLCLSYSRVLYNNAIANFEAIAGLELSEYDYLLNHLKSWSDITRARDLFIPGLGSFDVEKINTILQNLDGRTYYRQPNIGAILFPVSAYQSLGYFGYNSTATRAILSASKYKPFLAHLIQYKDFWLKLENIHRLDEIQSLYKLHRNYKIGNKKPYTVLRDAELASRTLANTDQAYVEFNLAKPARYVIDNLQFEVIPNSTRLKIVGNVLDNCVFTYKRMIMKKLCCLVTASLGDELIAVGELRKTGWTQISGYRHAPIDAKTNEGFKKVARFAIADFWPNE